VLVEQVGSLADKYFMQAVEVAAAAFHPQHAEVMAALVAVATAEKHLHVEATETVAVLYRAPEVVVVVAQDLVGLVVLAAQEHLALLLLDGN
jgi:hypothetical protein